MGPCRPQAKVDVDQGISYTQQRMDKATKGHRPHLPIFLPTLHSSSFTPLLSPLPHQ